MHFLEAISSIILAVLICTAPPVADWVSSWFLERARLALYLALLFETCARSCNIVGLNLNEHIVSSGSGRGEPDDGTD